MPEYSYWIIFGLILIIGEFVVSGLVLIHHPEPLIRRHPPHAD